MVTNLMGEYPLFIPNLSDFYPPPPHPLSILRSSLLRRTGRQGRG